MIAVRIAERELSGLGVRIHARLFFEARDERTRALQCLVKIIDAEEQEKAVAVAWLKKLRRKKLHYRPLEHVLAEIAKK